MSGVDPAAAVSRSVDGGLDEVPLPIETGALWLCGKRVVAPDPGLALTRAQATVVVCFNEATDLEREYPAYLDWLRDEANPALWFPIPDLHAPMLADAQPMVDAMVTRLRRDEGLILHCAGGLGRAPTIAVCVLIELGLTAPEALTHVRAHRPMGGPEAGAQVALVEAYARAVEVEGDRTDPRSARTRP